ncbi:MAG: Maf family protein [Lentisphaeria bacterium]|jgi:septum formation protein|nr:Maf family protein [Lentisphaeria bacterium]
MTLILASASPRRLDLLRRAGVTVAVFPVDVDESPFPGEPPGAHVERLALAKAAAAKRRWPESTVLGADTVVVLDGRIFGKPADLEAARATLRQLSGRCHRVLTGVCLHWPSPRPPEVWTSCTEVYFRVLDETAIAAYFARVNPLDKAGAYGIQAHGEMLVDHIVGLESNVVGLPVEEVLLRLRHPAAPF